MNPSRLLRRLAPVLLLTALLLTLTACGASMDAEKDCCMAAPVSQSTIS